MLGHKFRAASGRTSLCIVLAIFLAVVLLVNPLRETAMEDDWVYALTVRHLLDTGTYQLHDWAGANLPFQIYWGELFARLLGYSFSSLRLSTLFLTLFGLIAFYCLAKEHDLDDTQASLLTLGLLASPLVLRFSFNFMTDVPFLSSLMIALYLYTRAIRLHSYPLMLLGSVAASAAILTRQFGMALIGGLVLLWAWSRTRTQDGLFFLTGLALPVVAGLWQLSAGIARPNWGAQYFTLVQSQYFANPAIVLGNVLWRPTVILQYLALFCLPFVCLALLAPTLEAASALDDRTRKLLRAVLVLLGLAMSTLALVVEWTGIGQPGFGLEQILMVIGGIALSLASWWLLRPSHGFGQTQGPDCFSDGTPPHRHTNGETFDNAAGRGSVIASRPPAAKQSPHAKGRARSGDVLLLGVSALYIMAGILYGRYVNELSILMPYLGYNLDALKTMGRLERGILALVTTTGGILLARIFVLRYVRRQGWKSLPPAQRLLDLVTLALLLLQLGFAAMADQYLLVFLPFALIVMGRHMREWLNRYRLLAVVACLAMLIVSALWTRGLLAWSEAYWQGGESLLAAGVQPEQVFASWTWVGHYRFGEFVAEVPQPNLESERDFFSRWLPEQQARAEYWVTETLDAPPGEKWAVLTEIPYRDALLRLRHVYVIRRENQGEQ